MRDCVICCMSRCLDAAKSLTMLRLFQMHHVYDEQGEHGAIPIARAKATTKKPRTRAPASSESIYFPTHSSYRHRHWPFFFIESLSNVDPLDEECVTIRITSRFFFAEEIADNLSPKRVSCARYKLQSRKSCTKARVNMVSLRRQNRFVSQ